VTRYEKEKEEKGKGRKKKREKNTVHATVNIFQAQCGYCFSFFFFIFSSFFPFFFFFQITPTVEASRSFITIYHCDDGRNNILIPAFINQITAGLHLSALCATKMSRIADYPRP